MWSIIMSIRSRRRRNRQERLRLLRVQFTEPINEESQERLDIAELEKLFKIEVFLKRRCRVRDSELEKSCCICLSDIKKEKEYITLSCGHQYHYKCIRDWIRTKPNCPLCRKTCNLKRRICWD